MEELRQENQLIQLFYCLREDIKKKNGKISDKCQKGGRGVWSKTWYKISIKQAGSELGQAQVKLDDIVEVVVDVDVIGVVKVEV